MLLVLLLLLLLLLHLVLHHLLLIRVMQSLHVILVTSKIQCGWGIHTGLISSTSSLISLVNSSRLLLLLHGEGISSIHLLLLLELVFRLARLAWSRRWSSHCVRPHRHWRRHSSVLLSSQHLCSERCLLLKVLLLLLLLVLVLGILRLGSSSRSCCSYSCLTSLQKYVEFYPVPPSHILFFSLVSTKAQ
jgi:hypothetical protein